MNKILWVIVIILTFSIAYLLLTEDNVALAPEQSDEAALGSDEMVDEAVTEDSSINETVQASKSVTAPVAPVKTPDTTKSQVVPKQSTYDEDGNVIVRYTAYGFTPQTIEIKPGDAIHFINDNIVPMWIQAQTHPTAEYYKYASLNQGHSASKGESYIFTFTEVGAWGYNNLNKPSHVGVVVVTE